MTLMNCGHPVGTHEEGFECGNKSAVWLVPALRLWERGREGTWTGEPGWWKLRWPCPWNRIEFTIYLDRIIYHGCQPILKHTPEPRS
jgi:hypothetical protein